MLGQVQEGMAQMREGMAASRSTGNRLYLSRTLGSLAEALALVEKTDEHHWEAELYRLRAELLLMQGDEAGAEASLRQAIEVARQQRAKSWELRATTSVARLWHSQGSQGRLDEAQQMLAEIYSWFTEGFDTPDLKEAKALLSYLS